MANIWEIPLVHNTPENSIYSTLLRRELRRSKRKEAPYGVYHPTVGK